MDTGTHFAMGVALGGIATLDPAVANDPILFEAVFIGTIIGSQAPDIDTIFKLHNNATYIRSHRGFSHSLPAIFGWSLLISTIIMLFMAEISFFHLWKWTLIAVSFHVFVDLFNAYGTQALRPFSNKWIAFDLIHTFDPFIFFMHLVGICGWLLGLSSGYLWLAIYFIILIYYWQRYMDRLAIVKKIHHNFPDAKKITTSPTTKQHFWRVAFMTETSFYVGTVKHGKLRIVDQFKREPLPDIPIIELAKQDKNIAAFLSFSPIYRWQISEYPHYTEVRLIDLRYRKKDHYPFVAIVKIDQQQNILCSFTGWVFSEQKLQRKLSIENSQL